MFCHITVGSTDITRSSIFYDAVLGPLGFERRAVTPDGGPPSACWIEPGHVLPRFYVYVPYNGSHATVGNGSMVAFQAQTPGAVDAAYHAGLSVGGTDEGLPGERIRYGEGYYGAYLRDPDGNKLHVAYRGDLEHA